MSKRALLAIIGGGNMARAIILGALEAKLLAAFEVAVCEPDAGKRATLAKWGVQVFARHDEALGVLANADPTGGGRGTGPWGERGGQVLLAVKPQVLEEVAGQIRGSLRRTGYDGGEGAARVLISILAGTPTAKIRGLLGEDVPVVRVMPNTPASLRKGMSALAAAEGVAAEDAQFAYDLFATLGEVVKIPESLMDAFTALAGSGPAYVFYLAEAMIAAAQDVGFDRVTADRVVRQTVLGAAMLLQNASGGPRGVEPPEALRAAVTSKGGTTEAAVRVLEERGVMDAVRAAIAAGRDRGVELGR